MKVKVINLDSRPDRWEEVKKELDLHGFIYERFPALKGKCGENGCALSHHAILKEETGPIGIFEDDVIFEDGWQEVYEKAFSQLPEDWDLLYLGANVKTPALRYSENLFKITGGVHCTHAILYSDKGRKRVLDVWDLSEFHQIDHWMYMRGQGLLECYVVSPLIAFQRASYSDVRMKWFDYRGEMIENAKNNMQ